MIYIIWEFTTSRELRVDFETAYGPDGIWAQLFRRDPAYRQTLLLKSAEGPARYLTVDLWEDRNSYLSFKDRSADDYHRIDKECEKLTTSERQIGFFETVA